MKAPKSLSWLGKFDFMLLLHIFVLMLKIGHMQISMSIPTVVVVTAVIVVVI